MPVSIIVSGYTSGLIITRGYGTGSVEAPTLADFFPTPGATAVDSDTTISFTAVSPNGVNLSSLNVTIGGEDAIVNGVPQTPFYPATFSSYSDGDNTGYLITINPLPSFPPSTLILIYVEIAEPVEGLISTAEWSFTTVRRTVCFVGPALLLEVQMATPLRRFRNLEIVRQNLFRFVTDGGSDVVKARAILQHAYSLETHCILSNIVRLPEGTLEVRVCEKRRVIDVDRDMSALSATISRGLHELRTLGVYERIVARITEMYRSTSFRDRVSAIALAVVLATRIDKALDN